MRKYFRTKCIKCGEKLIVRHWVWITETKGVYADKDSELHSKLCSGCSDFNNGDELYDEFIEQRAKDNEEYNRKWACEIADMHPDQFNLFYDDIDLMTGAGESRCRQLKK